MIWLGIILGTPVIVVLVAMLALRLLASVRMQVLRERYPAAKDPELAHAYQQAKRRRELAILALIQRGVDGVRPWTLDGSMHVVGGKWQPKPGEARR